MMNLLTLKVKRQKLLIIVITFFQELKEILNIHQIYCGIKSVLKIIGKKKDAFLKIVSVNNKCGPYFRQAM